MQVGQEENCDSPLFPVKPRPQHHTATAQGGVGVGRAYQAVVALGSATDGGVRAQAAAATASASFCALESTQKTVRARALPLLALNGPGSTRKRCGGARSG